MTLNELLDWRDRVQRRYQDECEDAENHPMHKTESCPECTKEDGVCIENKWAIEARVDILKSYKAWKIIEERIETLRGAS